MERKDIPIPYSGNATRLKNQNKDATKYPQGYFNAKECRKCWKEFQPNTPSELYCSDNCKDEALAGAYLERNYGITIESYRDLYERQGGKCAICEEDGLRRAASANSKVGLTVDHNHATGDVRGLLCHTCNSALGQFRDSQDLLLAAVDYITAITPTFTTYPKKTRSRVNDLSAEKHLDILTERLDNGLNRKELENKFNITEAKVRGVIELKTVQAKEAYKRYCFIKESATTIPTGSTLQVNGSGSGSPLTDNAEGDDIVSSI